MARLKEVAIVTPKETGNLGEDYVAEYLMSKGCDILARNFRIRGGELDIVAKKGELLHVVEVKTRRPDPLSTGSEAITLKKQAFIIKAAEAFLRKHELDMSCVFDVAFVEVENGRVTDFKYIQRAFTA